MTNSDNDLHHSESREWKKTVGTAFYRNILREYGRVNQPKLIRDAAVKRKVLQMLESVARGIDRLEAVTKRMDSNTVQALLAKTRRVRRVKPTAHNLTHVAGIEIFGNSIPAETVRGDLFAYINFQQRYDIDARIQQAEHISI